MATVEKTSAQKPVRKMKKRGLGIYMQNILYKQVTLPFHNIGNNVNYRACERREQHYEYYNAFESNSDAYNTIQLYKSLNQNELNNKEIGYILDLRSNPGGLLSQAIKVADAFFILVKALAFFSGSPFISSIDLIFC